jgi:hypothetical protein
MAAKYRKIDPRLWNDERFRSLTSQEKLVDIYLLTAQVNRIGLFVFSPAMAAEALGIKQPEFDRVLDRVLDTLKWPYDRKQRVLFFPTWWKYNPCESRLTMKGYIDDLHDIPQTPLLTAFASNSRYLKDDVAQVIAEGMPYPMRYPMAYQEQEQEQEQELEQEQDGVPPPQTAKPEMQERFVSMWNSTTGVCVIRKLTDSRRDKLRLRMKDPEWDWLAALKKFPLKCFDDGSWVPTFDWFVRPDTVVQILEGKYDWKKNRTPTSGAPAVVEGIA